MISILQSDVEFLPPSKGEKLIRERELEHAAIKAHAARVSHQRRQWAKVQEQLKQQQQEQKEGGKEDSLCGRERNTRAQPQAREIILLLPGFHGSSDPFNAYPVKITPEINRIIGYARDVMLPNIFSPPYFRRLTAGGPNWVNYERSDKVIGGSNFLINMKVFRGMTEGAALGWLCSHIPPILRLNSTETTQKLSLARLKMRAKSLKLLREELRGHPESSLESLAALRLHIRTLYEAECMVGDTTAAKAHVDILLRLDDPITDENVRLQNLLVLMFNATELACRKLERTVLPFGKWTSERFTALWAFSSPYMPVPSTEVNDAHTCVNVSPLREAMVRLRYCLCIAETPLPFTNAQERLRGNMIFAWITTKTFDDIGILINLYMDIIEEKISFNSEGRRLAHACMVLTLLYMCRKCIHEAIIEDGTDVREASHIIMPRLEQDMITAMEMLSPAEKLYYQDAFLWMLYAGALHEQRQKKKRQLYAFQGVSNPPEEPWFTTTLAKHAQAMNVETWGQTKTILQKFVYDRYLEPDGRLWFDEAINIRDSFDISPLSDSKGVDSAEQLGFRLLNFSGADFLTNPQPPTACSSGLLKVKKEVPHARKVRQRVLVPKPTGSRDSAAKMASHSNDG